MVKRVGVSRGRGPAKELKRTEWPKRSVKNPEDRGREAKECVSRRECSTDLKAAEN